jgi:hypothetical protein
MSWLDLGVRFEKGVCDVLLGGLKDSVGLCRGGDPGVRC